MIAFIWDYECIFVANWFDMFLLEQLSLQISPNKEFLSSFDFVLHIVNFAILYVTMTVPLKVAKLSKT
jgi:hypothetical protein